MSRWCEQVQRPVPRCEVAPRTRCTTLAEEVPVTSCRDATLTLCEEVSPQEQLCRQQCRSVPVQRQVTVPQVGLLVTFRIGQPKRLPNSRKFVWKLPRKNVSLWLCRFQTLLQRIRAN